MKIEKGPFAGTTIPEDEITFVLMANGDDVPFWQTHCRTPIFLDKFPSSDGWQVIVENHAGPFNLPDTRRADGINVEILVQPTQLFVAKLIKDGSVYSQASLLAIIDGPSAWERGETTARGRLYEANGLIGFLPKNMQGIPSPSRRTTEQVPEVSPGKADVIPMSVAAVQTTSSSRRSINEEDEDQAAATAAGTTPAQESPVDTDADPAAETEQQQEPLQVQAEATESGRANVVQHPKNREDLIGRRNIAEGINDNLREQIIYLAEANGTQIPVIKDNKEAKTFYKQLLGANSSATGTAS